ncbi:MAG: hypothetical protein HQK67_12905 [Desulfamplus sp.]|nr:hypothetical protein [Desulfamplus sp.]
MSQPQLDNAELIAKAKEWLTNKELDNSFMDSLPYPAMLIQNDRKVVAANKVARDLGVEVASYCWDTFGKKASISEQEKEYFEKNNTVPEHGIKCTFCKADECLSSQEPINEKIPAGDITYDTYWVPLTNEVYLHYVIVL